MKKLLMLFASTLTLLAANPGDTGSEAWRGFGHLDNDPSKPSYPYGATTYYLSGLPYVDYTYYWSLGRNCVTCLEHYGSATHDPTLRGGHGFQNAEAPTSSDTHTNLPFMYIRCYNGYCADNCFFFRNDPSDPWKLIGQGHFPPYQLFTCRVMFGSREIFQLSILDAVLQGTAEFKMPEGQSKIYWIEFHLGGSPFLVTYDPGGLQQQEVIPGDLTDVPNRTIVGFVPYGEYPSLSFIAKPTANTWAGGVWETYQVLSCTNLVENAWELVASFPVVGSSLITYPIDTSGPVRFYKIN